MINIQDKPQTSKDLFFGDDDGISRLDLSYDTKFKSIAEQDEANVWFLNVVSCTGDRWGEFPPKALSKFQKTLAYQTVTDSLVPDVFTHLSAIATDPWLDYLYSRISTMEKTHAMSYSSGVDQAFGAKADEFMSIIYTDPNIPDRVADEVDVAERFIKAVEAGWTYTEYNAKLLLEVLFKMFVTEGVKFPFSFFTSWTLNKGHNNCAQGFSQLLIKICTDEMEVHTTTGANAIKKLRTNKYTKDLFSSGWFDTMATEYMAKVYEKELEWIDYLLEDGEVPGFNREICKHFIEYWIDRRLREIKLDTMFNVQKNDIEIWFDKYRNINGKSSALQEVDNVSYQIGQLKNDLHRFDDTDEA